MYEDIIYCRFIFYNNVPFNFIYNLFINVILSLSFVTKPSKINSVTVTISCTPLKF